MVQEEIVLGLEHHFQHCHMAQIIYNLHGMLFYTICKNLSGTKGDGAEVIFLEHN